MVFVLPFSSIRFPLIVFLFPVISSSVLEEMFHHVKGGLSMSLSFPFPTGLYRAFGEQAVTVVARDRDGMPAAVCVQPASAFDRAAALVLLQEHPDSFVIWQGHRYTPDGGPANSSLVCGGTAPEVWSGMGDRGPPALSDIGFLVLPL